MKGQSIETLAYHGGIKTGKHSPRGHRLNPCSVCGHVWTPEELAAKTAISDHMVNAHGFKREGAQVFCSKPCIACSKPALYKVGAVGYCKDHVEIGKKKLLWSMRMRDHDNEFLSGSNKDQTNAELSFSAFHESKKKKRR